MVSRLATVAGTFQGQGTARARAPYLRGMPDDPNVTPTSPNDPPSPAERDGNERCEVCNSDRLSWRNCKLICANCRSIVKSCADL